MKKVAYIIFSLGWYATALAQTTVQNFTKNDCNGNPHDLFAELNSGKVIILEYVMMNCAPCVTAGNGLKSIKADYAVSHPGKVELYAIGYDNSYTCADMNNWKNSNNLSSHTVFTEGDSDVNYYGGMGMPTIVIAGGWGHQLFYKKLGYAPSDNTPIRNALNTALLAASASPIAPFANVHVFPNPASEKIYISLPVAASEISISDVSGKTVLTQFVPEAGEHLLWLNGMQQGLYFICIRNQSGVLNQKLVIK
ncbi:MAG: T9SS type A sorting domain-containing protein [Bacteroidia bacterium]|nr:T9SS type A sorting domain-containing protein [Bacteroidia bacterium]